MAAGTTNSWDEATLRRLGYQGGTFFTPNTQESDSGPQGGYTSDMSPELQQWFKSKGYTADAPEYNQTGYIRDAQGNPIQGTAHAQGGKPKDNMWGDLATVAAIGAGMYFGLPALGLGEGLGAAGAAAGESALGAAAGESALGATAFPVAAGGADVTTALAGAPAYGLGGEAAAAGIQAPGLMGAGGALPSYGATGGLTGLSGAATGLAGAAGAAAGGGASWANLLNPGLNFLGTALRYDSAGKAAEAVGAGANAAATIQAQQRAPYVAAGTGALNTLSTGLAPGGQFNRPFTMADANNSDAMKTALTYAQRGADNSAAGKSGLLNSNAIQQSQQTSADIAGQFQNQAFMQNLQQQQMALQGNTNLAGIGERATGTVADAASNAALVGGSAVGSGAVSQGNILGDAISRAGNTMDITDRLGKIFGMGSGTAPPQVGYDMSNLGSSITSLAGG